MAFVGAKDMSVAKISEISSTSTKSFEDAIEQGIRRASRTLEGITGAWVNEMKVDITDGKISNYRVNLRVTFVLND
jgi:flavin-binding protein dodecin